MYSDLLWIGIPALYLLIYYGAYRFGRYHEKRKNSSTSDPRRWDAIRLELEAFGGFVPEDIAWEIIYLNDSDPIEPIIQKIKTRIRQLNVERCR